MAVRIPRPSGLIGLYIVDPDTPGYEALRGNLLIDAFTPEEIALADTLSREEGNPYYWVGARWFEHPEQAAREILRAREEVA